MVQTIVEQAHEMWKNSVAIEDIAMLVGVTEDQIKDWMVLEGWEQKAIEKIPYKPETSKYRTHVLPYIDDIKKWISKGMMEYEIRQKLRISKDSWIKYKKEETELIEIYSTKREILINGLENSLYKKAHGYNFTETTKEKDRITGKLTVSKTVDKQMAPDTGALVFALKNLDPENWRDKIEIESTQDIKITFDSTLNKFSEKDNIIDVEPLDVVVDI